MIILIGPDGAGKTTLAKRLSDEYGLKYFHYTKDSSYGDYLESMCSLGWRNAVLDRHAICEFPYSQVIGRKFRFGLKEWHNLILTTLIQNPLIILCTHKPMIGEYSKDQYLPYEKWDDCLRVYKEFLNTHRIPYLSYDYSSYGQSMAPNLKDTVNMSVTMCVDTLWWGTMWRKGWGCIGSVHPKVLLVAERIGPNNSHNIPFETGPTGHMLSNLLYETRTPLGEFTVTNLVKSWRRDPREPNDEDMRLLGIELDELSPKKVIFMGSTAKKGGKQATDRGIPHSEMTHFGYYSHRGDHTINRYIPFWRQEFGITPLSPL